MSCVHRRRGWYRWLSGPFAPPIRVGTSPPSGQLDYLWCPDCETSWDYWPEDVIRRTGPSIDGDARYVATGYRAGDVSLLFYHNRDTGRLSADFATWGGGWVSDYPNLGSGVRVDWDSIRILLDAWDIDPRAVRALVIRLTRGV